MAPHLKVLIIFCNYKVKYYFKSSFELLIDFTTKNNISPTWKIPIIVFFFINTYYHSRYRRFKTKLQMFPGQRFKANQEN